MPPTKKAPPAEDEVKTPEQEQGTQDPDAASPAEAETQEQRGDETPDPLAGLTTEQLREHPLFQEASADLTAAQKEEREKAYRDGQSAGAKQADEKTRAYAAAQEAIKTFDDLEQKRVSQDPDDLQEYANAMGNPKVEEAYKRGRSAKQGPGAEELRFEIADGFLTELNIHLDGRKELQGLSDEEKASLAKERHPSLGALVDAKIDLAVKHGSAAGRIAEDAKQLSDAKEEGRRDAYDEMGLNYPGPEIEGGTAPSGKKLPTKDELGKKTPEEIAELEASGDLDKILAGH